MDVRAPVSYNAEMVGSLERPIAVMAKNAPGEMTGYVACDEQTPGWDGGGRMQPGF